MKNNKGSFLATMWWLTGCLCLGVLLLLLAPREARISEDENRMLAGFPELTQQTLVSGEFFAGIEDFLSDGFFARAQVVELTDGVLGVFDKQTEEQRQMQEEARTNELLAADAEFGMEEEEDWADEPVEEMEPIAEPTITATPVPTPTVTLTPTAAPTATPTLATSTPMAELVNVLVTSPPETTTEPVVTPEPTAVPTPTPTATPKLIVPLEKGAEYTLTLLGEENNQIYSYKAENLEIFAKNLNHLKMLLPEDGEVHYLHVPVASVGKRLSVAKSSYTGWESTMEEALQTQVVNGVTVHDVPAILNDALVAKQDIYYYTDHHWTPLGAWYAADAVMQSRGYPSVPYEEYEYLSRRLGKDKVGREDWLHFLYPLAPVHSYVVKNLTDETEIDFMHYKSIKYTGYINNTRTPWRRFDTGFGSSRKALLISDSFGNVFLPYMLPYYGEVHMTDLRGSYFDKKEAGGTFTELLKYHGIDDIYVVLSTSNGINSRNSLEVFWNAISE
ncbi:MAG: hypothetical protein IKJ26_02765 [Clostridia bacterium]|nr:hypothetical protein [Clostridia bacterium]